MNSVLAFTALMVVGFRFESSGEVGRMLDGFDHCSDLEWFFEE